MHPVQLARTASQSLRLTTRTTASLFLSRHESTGTSKANGAADIRSRLQSDLKTAMKARDGFTSTTIRSVLAEIQRADKTSSENLADSGVISIIRKAVTRRNDSAAQFIAASRSDLANVEKLEADLLSTFLPSTISEAEIDRVLQQIFSQETMNDADSKKATGMLLKGFYAQVDKSVVDGQMVKQRAEALVTKSYGR